MVGIERASVEEDIANASQGERQYVRGASSVAGRIVETGQRLILGMRGSSLSGLVFFHSGQSLLTTSDHEDFCREDWSTTLPNNIGT